MHILPIDIHWDVYYAIYLVIVIRNFQKIIQSARFLKSLNILTNFVIKRSNVIGHVILKEGFVN